MLGHVLLNAVDGVYKFLHRRRRLVQPIQQADPQRLSENAQALSNELDRTPILELDHEDRPSCDFTIAPFASPRLGRAT